MLKWNVQGLLLQISHKRNCKNEFDIESFFFQLSGNNQAPQYSYSKKKINNHNRTYIYLTGSGIYII